MSFNVSGRGDAFRGGIRARGGKCVITGVVNTVAPIGWTIFEAAHVFPLEKEITDMNDTTGLSNINSCQSGFLLKTDVHRAFDKYLVSVNPDGNYKIVVFGTIDMLGIDGRILDPVCRNPADPHRVSDKLLRWHFRQSVLANIRGAGEPVFEHDFADEDMMKEIREAPYPKERFEIELAARLHGVV